jgi:signal recognition particle receptor subunit beta
VNRSTWTRPPSAVSAKVLIAGGFGVGKTTLVSAVSEIPPLTTEVVLTPAGAAIDNLLAVPAKTATTVAMDFGRITLADDLVLYLFGTPGQRRFWFMWDALVRGATGALVLVDVRRFADCFPAVDYFENARVPFVVVVNQFDGAPPVTAWDVRDALALDASIPIVMSDARARESAKQALIALVEYVIALRRAHRPS